MVDTRLKIMCFILKSLLWTSPAGWDTLPCPAPAPPAAWHCGATVHFLRHSVTAEPGERRPSPCWAEKPDLWVRLTTQKDHIVSHECFTHFRGRLFQIEQLQSLKSHYQWMKIPLFILFYVTVDITWPVMRELSFSMTSWPNRSRLLMNWTLFWKKQKLSLRQTVLAYIDLPLFLQQSVLIFCLVLKKIILTILWHDFSFLKGFKCCIDHTWTF